MMTLSPQEFLVFDHQNMFLWPHGSCNTIEIVHEDQLWKLFTMKIKWKWSSEMVSLPAWSATWDKTL